MPISRTALLALVSILATTAFADDPKMLGEYKRHDVRVTTLCTEGHVVVVAHSDVGQGGGLHMLQLTEEHNGKIVPMKCGQRDRPESRKTAKGD